jgi:predicted ribosome quality control (RQC) complex YloA/Tae2 family protein
VEGLLLAAALEPLHARLPAAHLGWRFPDATTLVLPLVPAEAGALWIDLRPNAPRVALVSAAGDARAAPQTPFQAQLKARTVGPLLAAEQAALDRRFTLRFDAGDGFVPTAAVRLEVELTGRNANAVLCDDAGVILGVVREVGSDVNRHRQLRPGLAYRPPPPYTKLDPRVADGASLANALAGRPIAGAHTSIDGVGRALSAAWARLAGLDVRTPLDDATLPAALAALAEVVRDPRGAVAEGGEGEDPARERREGLREAAITAARAHLEDRREVLRSRVRDAERAASAAADAAALRAEGDLLLAHAHTLERGAVGADLVGFDGAPVRLTLDPAMDAAGNARRRYERARKREARAARALERRDEAAAELTRIEADLAALDTLDDEALATIVAPARARRDRRRAPPGLRVADPRGFEIVIGRTARENDLVTFKVARSEDVWLHAQGYHGAHVVVRAEGREVPFETVLFAAELAAGHSDAGQSDNVPVDYTSRKDVWRSKGMPAGAVHYARQRTVFVTPRRRSEVA